MNKVIVLTSQNAPPSEGEWDEALAQLGPEWRVVSANTTIQPFGSVSDGGAAAHNLMLGSPLHVYYATTVVLFRESSEGKWVLEGHKIFQSA